MNQKQMRLNLLSTVISFLISLGINFYITPLMSEQLGDAAYGFVGMANDFVSYAAIVSSVLNSVAARFIALELHQGNKEKANKYYSSVFMTNVILAVILSLVGGVFVTNINNVFLVPNQLQNEVKITFFLTFLNYIIVLVSSIFTVCTYVTNRLDIAGIRNSVSYTIKFVIVFLLASLTKVHMYYIALATIAASIFLALTNIRLTKKLVPDLSLNLKNFRLKYIKILALSGVWMAVSNLSQVLMTGLDSVITNKMLGATEMGVLSVARTIPNAIILAISTLGVIFTPNFVELYAKAKNNELVQACKQSIKVMAMVLGIPIVGVIIFGNDFYTLWLPHKTVGEIKVIQILSVLMMMQSVFNALTISIAQLSVVTNKLKAPVFVSLGLGIINVLVVIVLIQSTELGIYVVAGVSSVLFSVRYLVFNPIYASYVLKKPWYTFYGTIIECLIPLTIVGIIFLCMENLVNVTSWLGFICTVVIVGVFGYAIVIVYVERKKIIGKIKNKRGNNGKEN